MSCSDDDGEETSQKAGKEQALLAKVTAGPTAIPENPTATKTLQANQETATSQRL